MRRLAGAHGRYIYGPDDAKVIASGQFAPKARLVGFPKWITWCVVERSGRPWLLANFHGQTGSGHGRLRRTWMRQGLARLALIQAQHDVADHRRIYAGDFNGHDGIVAEAELVDLVDTGRSQLASYNGWRDPHRGARIHMILVDRQRPATGAQAHHPKLSDSAAQVAQIRRLT